MVRLRGYGIYSFRVIDAKKFMNEMFGTNNIYTTSDVAEQIRPMVIQSITDATFIVCPRTVDSTIYQDDRAVSAKWLKACLDAKKLVSRTSMILYRPFPRLLKERILCLTGFGSDDRLKLESYIVYENS